ncbi:lipopolysaccharide biosynthesis protein [Aeromonas hydrophila]|uniref:lipopolysaccharide biosynthesis protein n=1 Tax=Aeromonas hydrophila TaxID=644 RepID=UPI002B4667AF|nr:hypothetical protein [Aeromonas hydrophila]
MILNRLTVIAMSASAWKMLGGPLTLIVISKYLNGYELGLYFTFISVAAIQQVFEMGISVALVQKYASRLEEPHANRVLFKASLLLYSILALLFLFFATIYGKFIFSENFQEVKEPWYLYTIVISFSLLLNPLYSWVEGQGEIEKTYRIKLLGSLITYASLWFFVLNDQGIYSLFFSQLCGVFIQFISLKIMKIYNVTRTIASKDSLLHELKNISQFQFKLSLVWITGYFYWNSYNVIIFKYITPEVAGIFGLSFAIVNAISVLSQMFLLVQRANIARYVSINRMEAAGNIYNKACLASVFIYFLASIVLLSCKHIFSNVEPFNKILSIQDLGGLLMVGLLMTVIGNMATYCRTSGKEYLFSLSMCMNTLTPIIALLVIMFLVNISYLIYSVLALHIIYTFFAVYKFKRFRSEYRY